MNKRAGRSELRANHIAIAVAAAFAPWSLHAQTPPAANTLPTGGVITHGSGTINAPVHTPTLSTMQIDQTSARMAAQFGSFSIGQSAHVNVSQPSSSSIALFKDVGGSVSQIYGGLTANGQIFISNQNGVLIGRTGRVESAGFIASTLSLDESEFMRGGNSFNWINNGATGRVMNEGTIITPGGYAMLAGPQVLNDGLIIANRGSVVLAAGDRVSLDLIGDGLIRVSVDQAALNASAINTGSIEADGGKVVLTARSANALLDTVVNAGGAIRATSLMERNGEIVLDGGSAGTVMVAGSHNAGSTSVSGAAITMSGTIATGFGGGTQTVTTPGTLIIQAGSGNNENAGLVHLGSGEQKVSAGQLSMMGGNGGSDNRALITSNNTAADQTIEVAGGMQVGGGAGVQNNHAIVESAGNQTLRVGANLGVEGGAFGSNNTAFVIGSYANQTGKKQTINAGSIILRSGAGGFQNGAVIVAPKQEITTTGDVLLAGGGTGGTLGGVRMGGTSTGAGGSNTATNLTLNVGNDLLLKGGVTPANSANIGSTTGVPQTITITAGNDVIVNDSPASVSRIGTFVPTLPANGTPGAISVTAGRDIKVNGGGEIVTSGTVTLKATNGAVDVNAVSPTAGNARVSSGGGQDIQAQSIRITAANGRTAQLINQGPIGEQAIRAATVDIQTAGPVGGLAEIRNNSGIGEQQITVTGERLKVSGQGGGTATIFGNGNQTIDMTSAAPKSITLGDNAAQGLSSIATNGDQRILGYADITMTGGSGLAVSGGSNALIVANNPSRTQRIEAGTLSMANSTLGGNSSVAAILGAQQTIHALGNVSLTANASGGTLPGVRIGGLSGPGSTATNLSLTVENDLLLTGGSVANNGVGIGTTAAPPAGAVLANNITIDAGGNVILTSGTADGTGARIGSSGTAATMPGDIRITAGGTIALNGTAQPTAIRTLGNVELKAASISEASNGIIAAGALKLSTVGDAQLNGANQAGSLSAPTVPGVPPAVSRAGVGGNLAFTNSGALDLSDVSVGGNLTLKNTGAVAVSSAVTSNGAMNLNVAGDVAVSAGGTQNASLSALGGQTIAAHSVHVSARDGRLAQIVNSGGNQTVTAPAIDVRTEAGGGTAEIRNNGVGEQTINAAGGSITLRGADSGTGRASLFSGGNQTINGNPDVFLTGGGSGILGAGNDARIETALGSARQTIHAGRIVLENSGLANSNTFSGFNSSHQLIKTTRDVVMKSGAGAHPGGVRIQGGNGATDLQLDVGGSLLISGGNAPGAGVGLGSSNISNNITVTAGGDVILNSGVNGARVGSSSDGTVGGNISISGRSIQLNGGASTAAIRTLDTVNLHADQPGGTISQTGNGFVQANALITSSNGDTTLTGPNEISRLSGTSGGAFTLVDAGSLQVAGISTTNDAITLTTDSLSNTGVITNGGGFGAANIVLNANAFSLANGRIEGGSSAVIVRPRDGSRAFGIEALVPGTAGVTTLTNADIASIDTSNFVVFGSGIGTTFTGNMTIGENARVEGGGKSLAFFRSTNPGAEMITIGSQGVATTGDVIIGAGGGGIRSNGGTITGDQVQLRAANGVGLPNARVKTAANALAINTTGGGGVFVSELDNVTLRTISLNVGGMTNTFTNSVGGSFSVMSGGDVNVAGLVSSAGSMVLDAGGKLNLNATSVDAELRSNGGQTISAQSMNLTTANGRRAVITNTNGTQTVTATTGDMNLLGAGNAGVAQILNNFNVIPGDQTINVGGQLNITGGAVGTSGNAGIFKSNAPFAPGGLQTVRAAGITIEGASSGTNAGAGIRSHGNQHIEVTGDINLRGGNGGVNNGVFISANPLALLPPNPPPAAVQQTIRAGNIDLRNGVGGVDTSATITAPKQDIVATGNVTLTSEAALVGTIPGGPGVRIGAPGGTSFSTDLSLRAVGNIVLNGGSAAENGAAIGSSGATVPATANNIRIDAGGNVILNAGTRSGTGVRIGSGSNGTAGGNISIKAGGDIQMNGTQRSAAIRTSGTVTLDAANISQVGAGSIIAGTLNTHSTGSTLLTGMDPAFNITNAVSSFNGVSGADLSFFNDGPLTVTGISAAGHASVVNAHADLNLTGQWTSATASIFAAGAVVESGSGAIQAASLLTDAPFGLSFTGANRVGVLDAKTAGFLTFNNAEALEVARVSASNGANLTSAGTMTISGPILSSGNVNLTAIGGSIVETGVGSITTNFGSLSTFSTGDTSLDGANQISSFKATSGGDVSLVNHGFLNVSGMNAAGDATISAFDTTVSGPWTAGGTSTISAGNIAINAVLSSSDVVLNAAGSITEGFAGSVFADTLSTTSGGSTTLTGFNQIANYSGISGADLTLNNSAALNVTALSAAGHAAVGNFGNVTVSGPWVSNTAGIIANGFGSTINETGLGSIQAGNLTTFSEGATSLTGANQLANFSGSTSFGGTGGITLNNSGDLNVTSLFTGGSATLTNAGDVNVGGSWSSGATNITTTGGDLSVSTFVFSNGPMMLDVGGALTVSANGPQSAALQSNGGQTIRAQAVEVVAGNGGFASINNSAAGEQRITISGGGTSAGLDVHTRTSGGNAQIGQLASGFAQTIEVSNADHINVNGAGPGNFPGSGAGIVVLGGTQTVSITGSGANAISVGSVGARGSSSIGGGRHQSVTAGRGGEQGSITITGADVAQTFVGISTNTIPGGTQTVSTSGEIDITGGRVLSGAFTAGLSHNGSGQQTVNAASITLTGGTSGNSNAAQISAFGGGNPVNGGAQVINVTGDVNIAGGAGGNAGILGSASRQQTIHAHNISVTNSAGGGNNSVGFIQSGHQEIHASGDMTLTARASGGGVGGPGVRVGGLAPNTQTGFAGTATDLDLFVGGNLVLNGGTAVNNGVGIGSSAAGSGLPNEIYIQAGGNVILNSGTLEGTAARIGSSQTTAVTSGNIEIRAGGAIALNGTAQPTAIRTLGTVTLDAASINESANGSIVAGALNLHTTGDALLNGNNQVGSLSAPGVSAFPGIPGMPPMPTGQGVGGNLAFTNTGALNMSNVSVGGSLSLNNTGSVAVSNAVTSNGPMNLNVAGDLAVSAAGTQDATLRAFGGQTINARSLAVTSSDGRFASVSNSGGAQTINLADGAGVDVRTLASGGSAVISNFGGDQTINVVNGDHINVNGSGGVASISGFGGTQSLSITGSGANAITLGAAGSFGPSQVFGDDQQVTAGTGTQSGSITIVGGNGNATFTGFSSGQIVGGTQTVSTSGTLRINGGEAPSQPVNGFATGLFHNGSGQQKVSAANLSMQGGSSGLNNVAIIISSGGAGTIAAGEQVIDVGSGNLSLTGGSGAAGNTSIIVSFADQTVTAGNVALQGGAGGAGNGAFINTQAGGQRFNVANELRVSGGTGGGAGINNGSTSPLNTGASQVINARSVVLEGGASGSNNGAFINSNFGGDQILTVPGTIRITGGAGGVGNRAGIVTNANQTIDGNPDILLAGGSGGGVAGNGNNVFLQATGGDTKLQTINARHVELRAGQGIDASATFNSARQVINTTGDVSLLGSSGAGGSNGVRIGGIGGNTLGATNLVLNVGGDLLLHGGSANGASLGSSGASTQSNNITVTAAGNVTLESEGAGARIGTSGQVPVTAGNIAVSAGGSMHLGSGSAIRTLDSVRLHADQPGGTISQGANGLIVANSLVTSSQGSTSLIGANQVSSFTASSVQGDVHLTNSKPVLTLGSMELPGNLTVVQTGDLAVGSASAEQSTLVAAAGDLSMSASGQLLVRGSDTTAGASGAVVAGGDLNLAAGNVALTGGSASGSFAQILGYSDINMTVGGFITLQAGSGADSWARIQTASRDSVITLNFPSLASGGYFVNGIEGLLRDGHTGFLSGNGVAALGHQLITIYGAP